MSVTSQWHSRSLAVPLGSFPKPLHGPFGWSLSRRVQGARGSACVLCPAKGVDGRCFPKSQPGLGPRELWSAWGRGGTHRMCHILLSQHDCEPTALSWGKRFLFQARG